MHVLSKQSRKYAKEKKDKLTAFILPNKQALRQLGYSIRLPEKKAFEMGEKFFFPDPEKLREMRNFEALTGKRIKLERVRYEYRAAI